jgi:hypothetical protein
MYDYVNYFSLPKKLYYYLLISGLLMLDIFLIVYIINHTQSDKQERKELTEETRFNPSVELIRQLQEFYQDGVFD